MSTDLFSIELLKRPEVQKYLRGLSMTAGSIERVQSALSEVEAQRNELLKELSDREFAYSSKLKELQSVLDKIASDSSGAV